MVQPHTRHIVGSGDRDINGTEGCIWEAPAKITKVIITEMEILSLNLPREFRRGSSKLSVIYGKSYTDHNFWDTFEGCISINQKVETFVA